VRNDVERRKRKPRRKVTSSPVELTRRSRGSDSSQITKPSSLLGATWRLSLTAHYLPLNKIAVSIDKREAVVSAKFKVSSRVAVCRVLNNIFPSSCFAFIGSDWRGRLVASHLRMIGDAEAGGADRYAAGAATRHSRRR
jgi:hypothetical protein